MGFGSEIRETGFGGLEARLWDRVFVLSRMGADLWDELIGFHCLGEMPFFEILSCVCGSVG